MNVTLNYIFTTTRTLDQLDRLISQNEAANAQRKQFKNQCKIELEELQARNEYDFFKEQNKNTSRRLRN